jgi:hypothetical protein
MDTEMKIVENARHLHHPTDDREIVTTNEALRRGSPRVIPLLAFVAIASNRFISLAFFSPLCGRAIAVRISFRFCAGWTCLPLI